MDKPTLSVILPNYNHSEYVGEALQAILTQSRTPDEVIVVDDGSTDDSVAVIERAVDKNPVVRLVLNSKNIGAFHCINKAMEMASGEYLYFASADDTILPGLFEMSLDMLGRYPEAGFSCCESETISIPSGAIGKNPRFLSKEPCYLSPRDLARWTSKRDVPIFGLAGKIVRASALMDAGGIISGLHWHSDGFVSLVMAFRHGVCYLPAYLIRMREYPDSLGQLGVKNWPANRKILDLILNLLQTEAYEDVRDFFKTTPVLAHFGWPIVYAMLSDKRYRQFLSVGLGHEILWNRLRNMISPFVPYPIKTIYRRARDRITG
ncbi:MAG: glycosyltransferase family A protein [Elusimicrobia bacterium]|nr:glycosyltransferase family A protein [Elusimicrobiota bacterium]